ncbi:TrkH family potassium uptake protein [Aurantimonas sp. A3-2-R12]|uniref:TrkH family potassium uptake protein n=1 Tax=Aurantimonas sp. A3-2-R12 TaxID=3114362 RepID=UPI002E19B0CA|nr:TrkH family potassium uptake protein [Aurantimonas sp. A3-2-R12]
MAGAMLVPALTDFAKANDDWRIFVFSAVLVAIICILVAAATRGERVPFTPRLGFLLVTSVWLVTAGIGALPLYFGSVNVSFAGAFFESMSGLTTTGSTVISGLDALPPGLLLWRSLLQWLGGIGIIGMAILILPSIRGGGLSLFHMESSDKSEKILPRVNQLAAGLMAAYAVLTVLCVMAYAALGMSFFDAVNHAMTTLATGGFSTHDSSMGYFDDNRILAVSSLFMVLASLPFVIYIRALLPLRFQRWNDPQIPVFLTTCLVLSVALAATRHALNATPFNEAFVSSAFNLISVITTTGFASEDYTLWSNAATGVFFLAMFLGGCAGSTAGGIKANRLVILFLLVKASARGLFRPHAIRRLRYGNQEVTPELLQTVTLFVLLFFGVLLTGTVVLTSLGLDFLTAFSGALTALANVGPGFGQIIGPAGNFGKFSDSTLWVLSAIMLLGRLEIVTVLVLLFPATWID